MKKAWQGGGQFRGTVAIRSFLDQQIGGSSVQPYARAGRLPRCMPLGQETCRHSGQHITHAAGGHAGIAAAVDGPAAIRGGYYRTRPLQYRHDWLGAFFTKLT